MKIQDTRVPLRQVVGIAILLALFAVCLLARDWRSALLAGVGATYLIARQLDLIMNLGLVSAWGRLRTRWKIALTLLIIVLVQIPLILLSDWDDIRVPALVVWASAVLVLLGWTLWTFRRGSDPERRDRQKS